MGATALTKVALSLGGVVGISTSVGIPVSLHVQNQTDRGSQNLQNKKISQVSISRCKNESGNSINFGDSTVKTACGSAENDTGKTNSNLAEDLKYNQLFQNMGNDRNGYGSSGTNHGKTNCQENKGTFNGQGSGTESLGLCEGIQSQDQGLIVENDSSTTIKVCSGECFVSQNGNSGKTLIFNQTKNNGRKVQFKKLS